MMWRNLNEIGLECVRMRATYIEMRHYLAFVTMCPLFGATWISVDSTPIQCAINRTEKLLQSKWIHGLFWFLHLCCICIITSIPCIFDLFPSRHFLAQYVCSVLRFGAVFVILLSKRANICRKWWNKCNTGFDSNAIQYCTVLSEFSFNRAFELINLNIYVPKRSPLAEPVSLHSFSHIPHTCKHHQLQHDI